MKFPRARILVFAKDPEPGTVKTRLIPLLGAEEAARLHARFVHNTLHTACSAGTAPVELWCSPGVATPFFRDCLQRHDITLHAQSGADLGQRMHHAISDALGRATAAVLVGTDCPGLCATDLVEALEALDRGAGTVLGPARDGGYYLVGLTQPDPVLFDALDWGSAGIFSDTVSRLADRGRDYHRLISRDDVDTPGDYRRLIGDGSQPV